LLPYFALKVFFQSKRTKKSNNNKSAFSFP